METFLATLGASVALAALGFPFWVAMHRPKYFSTIYLGYAILLSALFIATFAYVIGYDDGARDMRALAKESLDDQGLIAAVPFLQANHFGGYGYLLWPLPLVYQVILLVCGPLLRPEETRMSGD